MKNGQCTLGPTIKGGRDFKTTQNFALIFKTLPSH